MGRSVEGSPCWGAKLGLAVAVDVVGIVVVVVDFFFFPPIPRPSRTLAKESPLVGCSCGGAFGGVFGSARPRLPRRSRVSTKALQLRGGGCFVAGCCCRGGLVVASASAAKWTCFGVLTVAALSVAFVVGCSELCVSVCRALCCSGCFGLAFWFVGGVAVVSPILVSRATEGDSRLTVSFHFWGP